MKLPKQQKRQLPKQWKDWCSAARLHPRKVKPYKLSDGTVRRATSSSRGLGSHWMYLHGRGREWRVNCFWELQCGDTYAKFDRWALCDYRETPMPKTKAEFVRAVKALVAQHPEKKWQEI